MSNWEALFAHVNMGVQAGTRYLVYSGLLQTIFGLGICGIGGLVLVRTKSLFSIVAVET